MTSYVSGNAKGELAKFELCLLCNIVMMGGGGIGSK